MKSYDWIIVGGGIAGISVAEILSREGHSVALIEKNKKLASVATKEFHEWVHTGSLYTLVEDQMKTLKYILGSLDDLLEFYSSYKNMNISPTAKGLEINESKDGWFNKNYINFNGESVFRSKKEAPLGWKEALMSIGEFADYVYE